MLIPGHRFGRAAPWSTLADPRIAPWDIYRKPGPLGVEDAAALRLDEASLIEHRIRAAVRIAREYRTGIRLVDLSYLLPSAGPASPSDLAQWIESHPEHGNVVGDRLVAPDTPFEMSEIDDRRSRGELFWREAESLWSGVLQPARPLVCAASVTGSTAYGEPEAGDDLDFMTVTRNGTVWVFLVMVYLMLRLRPRADRPSLCFNYVLDEETAAREFRSARGVLFAKEALTARPVIGGAYYRALVASARWMRSELPRLYDRWAVAGVTEVPRARRASWAIRVANLAIYPWLAAYLQVQGLVRNRRLQRQGDGSGRFRTVTSVHRLVFETARFEHLRSLHVDPSAREVGS